MTEKPLLILPTPKRIPPPSGRRGGGGQLRFPDKKDQVSRFGPIFRRLREVLDGNTTGAMELRDDPSSLAPDRVIVFEIAGTVSEFVRAVSKVSGLEFMAEYEAEEEPDDLFAEVDKRKGKEGQDRTDKNVAGRFYLAMPDMSALQQLLGLWGRWERNEDLGIGYAPFKQVFAQLRRLRPWGVEDRIPVETISYWKEETAREPDRPVRTEVELWFHENQARRQQSSQSFATLVSESGGVVVSEAIIEEIAYHGVLIDIPANELSALMERGEVYLALADEVMFLRPQSLLIGSLEPELTEDSTPRNNVEEPTRNKPIAALFDGVPVQGHDLLAERLIIDDPDDLSSQAIVSRRIHGTAMSSLILHGDRNIVEPPLTRLLYVRPLMFASADGIERTEDNRLLIDTIYRAIIRIKGSNGEEPAAPTVFLVNLSIGDTRRPFSRLISPLARLLDFLSERYNILFLVSGGNITAPLTIPEFDTWSAFETSTAAERERAMLAALNAVKHERTILSPGEALNVLTIGAQHHDNISNRPTTYDAVDPFDDNQLPNASSALGLGPRRTIKPDIYLPGGREHVRMGSSGGGVKVRFGQPQRLYGLMAAAPDSAGRGRLNQIALSDGTSSATALATRAAHRIFDSLMDRDSGSRLADMSPEFYAVVIKTLLVHSARWNDKSNLLKEICGPSNRRRHVERAENASRFMGFGVPHIAEVMECTVNRATLVGYGDLEPNHAHSYRIPLPICLERVTDPRSLTITLAWFSPIKSGHQSYRCVKLEATPSDALNSLGINRLKEQPADALIKRGTVFHERYHGAKAVPFIDNGHLALHVWCKEDVGGIEHTIRYGLAVTIEAETPIPVYDEIKQRLRVTPRPLG